MRLILLLLIQFFLFQTAKGQSFAISGKWRTLDLYHDVFYYFDSSGTVLVSQYGRELIGVYSVNDDTVSITYRPFFTVENLEDASDLSDSLRINIREYYFYRNRDQPFPSKEKNIIAYYPNSKNVVIKTNESGRVAFPSRSKIDSVHCYISAVAPIKIPADSIRSNRLNISANKFGVDVSGFTSQPKKEKMIHVNEYKLARLNRISLEIEPAVFLYRLEKDSTYLEEQEGILNARLIDNGSPYLLRQYIFHNWVTVDTLYGQGKLFFDIDNYKLPYLHSGINRFSLKTEKTWRPYMFEVASEKKEVKIRSSSVTDYIDFSDETYYELYYNGKLVSKGIGNKVACSTLEEGKYYLNYDNTTSVKIKKIKR